MGLKLYAPEVSAAEEADAAAEALAALKDRVADRLISRMELDPETECWVFTGRWQPHTGLGVVKVRGKQYMAQRVAKWLYHGGFDLDDGSVRVIHSGCRTPACCNPDHLAIVTRCTFYEKLVPLWSRTRCRRPVRAETRAA